MKQAAKAYDPVAMESSVQARWEREGLYEAVKRAREGGERFYFIDGPPYTSGAIHLGTAWNKTLKDAVIRWLRMRGYNVRDQPGYDMHGLPIEVKVEKELGIRNKREIERRGIETFVATCRSFALRYKDQMTEEFRKLGVWLDWEHPYLTITNEYILTAWWTLGRAEERGLLAEAERVLTWCPRCETALAEAEVEYWDETDPSVYLRFRRKDHDGPEPQYFAVWTTTPWTLPADLCIAVHPDFEYVRIGPDRVSAEVWGDRERGSYWVVASQVAPLVERLGWPALDPETYVLERVRGEEMEGWAYVHPMLEEVPFQQSPKGYWFHRVVLAEYVTEEYTGIVHTAPGHGPDDFETGRAYDLPPFCPVDEAGCFTKEVPRWAGRFTKEADPEIIGYLRDKQVLIKPEEITHRYGHCWRCNSPITYRTTKQWFIRLTEMRKAMLDEVRRVDWYPSWAGSSRQYAWVENTRDWCISRQRYWGIPIPVWRCSGCGKVRVVSSLGDLAEGRGYEEGMDLHRPWVDRVTFDCPSCGGTMHRVPDVLDVWFDSAVCAWAQLGYPMQTEEFERWWPCRWITEAHDQTRGWFYSQLGAGVVAFDRAPYDAVLMHGFALDSQGRPMSKSLGNNIAPKEVTDRYGTDPFRFYLLESSAPWEDLPFNWDGVRTSHALFGTLWNVYYFATTYMALDGWTARGPEGLPLRPEDRWVLSRLEACRETVDEAMKVYELHRAARAVRRFVQEDLSRWYVRLVRERTWQEANSPDKEAAYATLHRALTGVALLLAPFAPHTADEVHLNLAGASVHLADWPDRLAERDEALERQMGHVQRVVEAAAKARQRAGIKLRWPVDRIYVQTADVGVAEAVGALEPVLLAQCNAKGAAVVRPDQPWEGLRATHEAEKRVLGPLFKARAKAVADALDAVPTEALLAAFRRGEPYTLDVGGEPAQIDRTMVRFSREVSDDFQASEFPGGVVFVPKRIPPELRSEGMAREFIRRIQEMRKELDLDVESRIYVLLHADEAVWGEVRDHLDAIGEATRASGIERVGPDAVAGDLVRDWEVEGATLRIGVQRA